jgi:Protein of unknown function (DUF2949)
MTTSIHFTKLIHFLQEDIAIPASSMAIVFKQIEYNPGPLPMILWQYGLVTIEQLNRIYDWIEDTVASTVFDPITSEG